MNLQENTSASVMNQSPRPKPIKSTGIRALLSEGCSDYISSDATPKGRNSSLNKQGIRKQTKFKTCLVENTEIHKIKEVGKKLLFDENESSQPFNLLESPIMSNNREDHRKKNRNSINSLAKNIKILKLR